jgi:hypothetical protein
VNAAYEFLRTLGCQFLAWDYSLQEELPTTPPPTLPELDLMFDPVLEYRDNNEWAADGHGDWGVKLGQVPGTCSK